MRPVSSSLAVLLLGGSVIIGSVGPSIAAQGARGFAPTRPGVLRSVRPLSRPVPIPRYADVTYGAGTLGGAENPLRFRPWAGDVRHVGSRLTRHGDRSHAGYDGIGYGVPPIWAGDPASVYGERDVLSVGSDKPTTVGIPPSPVAPAAIYVIGGSGRDSSGSIRRLSGRGKARPSGPPAGGPLLIRLSSTR